MLLDGGATGLHDLRALEFLEPPDRMGGGDSDHDERERRGEQRPAEDGSAWTWYLSALQPTPYKSPVRTQRPATTSAALRPWLSASGDPSGPFTSASCLERKSTTAAVPAPAVATAAAALHLRAVSRTKAAVLIIALATPARDDVR